VCVSNNFSPATGVCNAVRCGAYSLTNTNTPTPCLTGSPYNTVCNPVCRSGYDGTPVATCSVSATWSTTGSCVIQPPCSNPPPAVNNGVRVGCSSGTTVSGNQCNYTCAVNFTGPAAQRCLRAAWSQVGKCTFNGCEDLPTPPEGNKLTSRCAENSFLGTTCELTCDLDKGYNGTNTILTCIPGSPGGRWSDFPQINNCKGKESASSGGSSGAVIGAAVGSIIAVIAVAALAFFVMKKRKDSGGSWPSLSKPDWLKKPSYNLSMSDMKPTSTPAASAAAVGGAAVAGGAAATVAPKKAPPPLPPKKGLPLPANWEEFTDDSGKVYYYNSVTQKSMWERPTH
jgi:hypothetical protein